jgi:hypothetical protein
LFEHNQLFALTLYRDFPGLAGAAGQCAFGLILVAALTLVMLQCIVLARDGLIR